MKFIDMSIQLHQIELKSKGFLISYDSNSLEFIPLTQVRLVRYQSKDVHIHLQKDGVRIIYCKNEAEAKHFFNSFLNHFHQSL